MVVKEFCKQSDGKSLLWIQKLFLWIHNHQHVQSYLSMECKEILCKTRWWTKACTRVESFLRSQKEKKHFIIWLCQQQQLLPSWLLSPARPFHLFLDAARGWDHHLCSSTFLLSLVTSRHLSLPFKSHETKPPEKRASNKPQTPTTKKAQKNNNGKQSTRLPLQSKP